MTDIHQMRELAREADDALKSGAFDTAKAAHREILLNALIAASTAERKLEIVAQLKTLDETYGQLKALINNYNAEARARNKAAPHAA